MKVVLDLSVDEAKTLLTVLQEKAIEQKMALRKMQERYMIELYVRKGLLCALKKDSSLPEDAVPTATVKKRDINALTKKRRAVKKTLTTIVQSLKETS